MKKLNAKDLNTNQKIDLITGKSVFETNEIQKLEISSKRLRDGTNGLRIENYSTICYPSESAVSTTWNCKLAEQLGEYIADECVEQNVDMLLAPAVNIKRTPLCGRNFEYYSEDPYLTAEFASAFINGVQSLGVASCVKHFAAYNSEIGALFGKNSEVDERTLREIYLKAFEIIVKKAKPAAVMAAYNRLNGVFCCENKFLLDDILRKEWKYDGLIVSDWGAIHNRVNSLKAGVDLEMPNPTEDRRKELCEAIDKGDLDISDLNRAVDKVLCFEERCTKDKKRKNYTERDRKILAKKIADESVVLLKNEDNILPLNVEKCKKIAVIGELAKKPAYQGGGCAHVESNFVSAYDCLEKIADGHFELKYCRAYDSESIVLDGNAMNEAVVESKNADVVLCFVGTQHNIERETFNRTDIGLPNNMLQILDYVLRNNQNVIVVVQAGSPVDMRLFANRAKAIIMQYYSGDLGGEALVDVLTGKINPSGKLSETFPEKISDTPSCGSEIDYDDLIYYSEGQFVGYRHYDYKNIQPLYEFGFGLSYTEFLYSDLNVNTTAEEINISFKIKNIGKYDGAETAQVYIGNQSGRVVTPLRELKCFGKKYIKRNEEAQFDFKISWSDMKVFVPSLRDWHVFGGRYDVYIGASSRDIRLKTSIQYINENDLT